MTWERTRPPHPYDFMPRRPEFTVTTTAGRDGDPMPLPQKAAGIGGADSSPALTWRGAPPETQSFAISCFDIDAPTPSGVWHWIVTDIPAETDALPENAAALPDLGVGARTLRNDLGSETYDGAAPPEGDHPHRYLFTVHALAVPRLEIPPSASAAVATFIIGANTIARAHTTLVA
ncbi:UPF0098 protein [Leifsonia sp. LS1]|uniref:YbhB/YbcL family Raf kinase inhibitor-like protein n=1 Tax=Leifsonia sp. LS1 TaxID=2828483 RepID=UPI001CFCC5B5|nr:YbhB/YbcL family Raf kinase inhibitor-like protein [Leifsonia sp. LS1]GIT78955.1 UPF0098 protein [Leifsonia sp. LS1]